jgi:hypothetical protein
MSAARAPQGFRRSTSRVAAPHPGAQVQRPFVGARALAGAPDPAPSARFGTASAVASFRSHGSQGSLGSRWGGNGGAAPPRNVRLSGAPPAGRAPGRQAAPASLKLPIRIRFVLLAALLLIAVVWTYPRGVAAWRLQGVATELADYALCMAGPTGLALMRDNAPEFQRLVRIRLITASAQDRPFAECAARARDLTGSASVERAHRASAVSFAEYGLGAPGGLSSPELELSALQVTARPVVELSRRAWPFVRSGYTKLIRPLMGAREAVHPVALPRAALGSGLPAWRAYYRTVRKEGDSLRLAVGHGAHLSAFESRDRGVSWRAIATERVAAFAERCVADDTGRAFTLSLSEDTGSILVTSTGPDAPPSSVPLAPADVTVFATACDAGALVAALTREGSPQVSLLHCPLRAACTSMPLPTFGGLGAPQYPLDIARVGGTTVLAVPNQGIVRVASSRDNGRSWTPFSVAFDPASQPAGAGARVPERLLVVGSRVMLHGVPGAAGESYPVLFSDDHGASWRGS